VFKTLVSKNTLRTLTGKIDWELEAIPSAQNSWKDELWLIVFVCIPAANFVPSLQDAMVRGFAKLSKYQAARAHLFSSA
jgi:hypothetical protein